LHALLPKQLNYIHYHTAYLDKTFSKQNLNGFLQQWKQAGMMDSDAFPQERQNMLHLVDKEHTINAIL